MTFSRFSLSLLVVGVSIVSVTTASQHTSGAHAAPTCPMMHQMMSGSNHQATGTIHAALGKLSMTELHTLKASVEEKLHMLQQTQSPDKATRAQIRMYKQLLRRIEKHLSTM